MRRTRPSALGTLLPYAFLLAAAGLAVYYVLRAIKKSQSCSLSALKPIVQDDFYGPKTKCDAEYWVHFAQSNPQTVKACDDVPDDGKCCFRAVAAGAACECDGYSEQWTPEDCDDPQVCVCSNRA